MLSKCFQCKQNVRLVKDTCTCNRYNSPTWHQWDRENNSSYSETALLIWLILWMVCFLHVIQLFQLFSIQKKTSWFIKPLSKSKELFSGSQGFYLLSISVLSRDTETVTLQESYRLAFSCSPCLFQKYLQPVQIVFGICCLSKRSPNWVLTWTFSYS